ncbi:MAG: hypothetical protein EBU52_16935, partial [Cytophagia bacterium]|nr:hypothetical protein [Cytophagia bacterium]
AENNLPVVNDSIVNDGRKPGDRAAWLKANPGKKGSDYYAWKRKQGASGMSATSAPAAGPSAAPVAASKYRDLPDTLAMKAKVAEIITADPEVSDEDVIARITADAEAGEILNTDPDAIRQELTAARSAGVSGKAELDMGSEEEQRLARHAAIRAAMARRGMKTGDPEKLLSKKKYAKRRGTEEEPETLTPDTGDTDDVIVRRGPRSIDSED